jgi:hypothetical protein
LNRAAVEQKKAQERTQFVRQIRGGTAKSVERQEVNAHARWAQKPSNLETDQLQNQLKLPGESLNLQHRPGIALQNPMK